MSRIALDFGFIQIYWYSICIIIGMAIGMFFVYRESRRKKINEEIITDLIFYTIIGNISSLFAKQQLHFSVFFRNLRFFWRYALHFYTLMCYNHCIKLR